MPVPIRELLLDDCRPTNARTTFRKVVVLDSGRNLSMEDEGKLRWREISACIADSYE